MSKTTEKVRKTLGRRYRAEKRFRAYGIASVSVGLLAVALLFSDIISKGTSGFFETYVQLEVTYDSELLGINNATDEEQLMFADFSAIVKQSLRQRFPEAEGRAEKRELYSLISNGASYSLRDHLKDNPRMIGKTETMWLLADDDVDVYSKADIKTRDQTARLSVLQQSWIASLEQADDIDRRFNASLFTRGDSREPELAGLWGAAVGSFFTMLVTIALAFPIGVAAAIYLEEFAPKNKITDFIEVNINNLAAVPSIIFGLLGLAVFIGFFGMPRSVPLVGGIVLTLMTLPTIIISARASIKSVPPSIREAALGLGASKMQVVLHHVLPLALPGMLTGAIIGMAQALGETAPLLMIGMVAFIVDVPGGVVSPATVLPVQIYLWADSPETSFVALTSAAIMVLLGFLITMNTLAVILRKRLERRW